MAKTEAESETKMYKLTGTRNPGEVINRIIVEGSSHSPEVYIDADNAAPLTEDQVKEYRKSGYTLTAVDEEKVIQSTDSPKTPAQQQAAQVPNPGNTGNVK
jgi:hypothetical protein